MLCPGDLRSSSVVYLEEHRRNIDGMASGVVWERASWLVRLNLQTPDILVACTSGVSVSTSIDGQS